MKNTIKRLLLLLMAVSMCLALPVSAQAATLKAPTNVRAVSASSDELVLKWNKVSAASGYYVYRSVKKKSGFKKIATLKKNTLNSYAVAGLTCGKPYYFKIVAYRGKRKATSKTVMGRAVPCKVEFVKLIRLEDSVAIRWSLQRAVSGYQIYRATDPDGPYKKRFDYESFCSFDGDIKPASTYYYKVRAFAEYGGKTYYGKFSEPQSICPEKVCIDGIAGTTTSHFTFRYSDIEKVSDKKYKVYGDSAEGVRVKKAVGDTYKKGKTCTVRYRRDEDTEVTMKFKVVSSYSESDGYRTVALESTYINIYNSEDGAEIDRDPHDFYLIRNGAKSDYVLADTSYVITDYNTSIYCCMLAKSDVKVATPNTDNKKLALTKYFDLYKNEDWNSVILVTAKNAVIKSVSEYT